MTQVNLTRRGLAAERWKILRRAILSAVRDDPSLRNDDGSPACDGADGRSRSSLGSAAASVMCFSSFNLLAIRQPPASDPNTTATPQIQPSKAPCSQVPSYPSPPELWRTYCYTKTQLDSDSVLTIEADVRQVPCALSVDALLGFNNTGNVCVWPSEEVMAYHCLEHLGEFVNRSVCELGGGMTCLAGLMLACSRAPKDVWLTDGNETSVENIVGIISSLENRTRFGNTIVSASAVLWDEAFLSEPSPNDAKYDFVICSDCLFFDEVHSELARVILKLLKSDGTAWLFAPSRSGSLDRFCSVAGKWFDIAVHCQYSKLVWRRHQEAMADHGESGRYSPDLHYPLMLVLRPL